MSVIVFTPKVAPANRWAESALAMVEFLEHWMTGRSTTLHTPSSERVAQLFAEALRDPGHATGAQANTRLLVTKALKTCPDDFLLFKGVDRRQRRERKLRRISAVYDKVLRGEVEFTDSELDDLLRLRILLKHLAHLDRFGRLRAVATLAISAAG